MAYWLSDTTPYSPTKRQFQFYIDQDSDVSSLPTSKGENDIKCGKGSVALSIATGKIFILNSNDEWVEIGG